MMRKRVCEAEETASKKSSSVSITITTQHFLKIQESTTMTRKEKCILCYEETLGTTLFCKTLHATLQGLGAGQYFQM